ncbi:Pimeloyl-ACP methyl ester carboxylesterase [Streptomyces sp. 2112.3]|uniref:alpha/beta fold hydrolase n=1 Tax=Streptomyces sp. 2112.3 TaxID=1881023 RepID=UPI00089CBBB3|nr:alpha/beta fold hydrolase [Streptomyces sp. 2112.3]SED84533.1 Pimeloyl-ACP methyl ester carboxylesterase [Streptomyces sp. 2112.3]
MGSVFRREITVGYDDEGSGEPLVLVHGHPFNRSMWRPQTEYFSRAGHRVIAPDLRGYGDSTMTTGTTTAPGKTPLATFARDLVDLLDHLGIERCTLGGLSMGGQIVMECYRLFPERISALLLADTFAAAETPDGKTARYDMAERLLREGMADYAHEVLDKMVSPDTIAARPDVAAHVLEMMTTTPPEGAAAALRGRAERPDYTELLPRITVPALVVVGTEDTYTPVSDARHLHERIPDSRLTIIEQAAHMPNLEQPHTFNAALHDFLNSLPKASATTATTTAPQG